MKKNWLTGSLDPGIVKKWRRIMRITVVLIFGLIMTVNANSYSQVTKLNIRLTDSSIRDVFEYVEENSKFVFLYKNEDFNVDKKVDVNFKNATINEILDEVLTGEKVVYDVYDRQIVIRKSDKTVSPSQQQNKSITGIVIDNEGLPLPGVTVLIKGTTQGTVTNADGVYSLSDIPDGAILRFSFVGMLTQEVEVGSQTIINITMKVDAIGLDEVVAIGYGTQKKVTLTGAAFSVKADDLTTMPNSSLAQTLEGRAPGVRIIQASSITGASARIRIRGSNADPLYVIDDVVMPKESFDNLMAGEIETINFLKDASTSSVYGARAANGVVVVTTKKGRFNQKAQFNYYGSAMAQYWPISVDDFDYTFDKVRYAHEMKSTGGFTDPGFTDQEKEWLAANPDFNGFGSIREWAWQRPKGQKHSVSARGGMDNISYFASLGIEKAKPGFGNGDFNKYNYRTNITAKITPTVTLEWISDGYIRESNRPYFTWQSGEGLDEITTGLFTMFSYPNDKLIAVVIDEEAGTGRIASLEDIDEPGFHHISCETGMLDGKNGSYRRNTWRDYNNKIRLTWDLASLTKGLKVSALGNYSVNTRFFKEFTQYYVNVTPTLVDPNNRFEYSTDLSKWSFQNYSENRGLPTLKQKRWNGTSYQYNFFLNYDRSFGLHNVSGLVLYEASGNYNFYEYGRKRDFVVPGVDQLFNYSDNPENTFYDGSEYSYSRASYVGRLSYNYDEKYIFQFSWRNDASSLFPSDTRWGFFPSASVAWRINKENFFDVDWISALKPRFSYGTSGSEGGIAGFQFQNKYEITSGWEFGSGPSPGIRSGVLPNLNITWAKTTEYNVGLDFGLFNNILTGGVDFFYKKNTDKLGVRNQQFPSTWGASLPAVNYASDDVRGVDLYMNLRKKIGQFTYRVNANVSYAKDKYLILDENPEIQGTWRSSIGRPVSIIWGYHSLGVIKDQATLDGLPEGFTQFGRTPTIGDLLLDDIRGTSYSEGPDGKIDVYDNDILSENGSPRIVYGFALGVSVKDISLDAQFSGVGAYDKYYQQTYGHGSIMRDGQVLMERWHPVLNPDGIFPTYRDNYWRMVERGHGPSSTFMLNASYLRLKNLALSYDLPKNWLDMVHIQGIKVYVAATDLFVFSKWLFSDPESPTGTSYPRLRTISGGINITF